MNAATATNNSIYFAPDIDAIEEQITAVINAKEALIQTKNLNDSILSLLKSAFRSHIGSGAESDAASDRKIYSLADLKTKLKSSRETVAQCAANWESLAKKLESIREELVNLQSESVAINKKTESFIQKMEISSYDGKAVSIQELIEKYGQLSVLAGKAMQQAAADQSRLSEIKRKWEKTEKKIQMFAEQSSAAGLKNKAIIEEILPLLLGGN